MFYLTRRQLLKATAAGAALAALGGGCGTEETDEEEVKDPEEEEGKTWHKTVCRYCGVGCGAMVGVKEGKVTEVKADEDNPVNKGQFCVKAYFLADILYTDNRLKTPMIRKNGELEEASWDEALDLIAEKFTEIKDNYGPDALSFYGSGQCSADESYVYNKLFKGFIGTNNVEGNPRTCMASAVAGYVTTFGSDEPMGSYDDIEDADVFFLIGSNAPEAHPVLWAKMLERRSDDPDVELIVADPRETRATNAADEKIIFKPGTDLALLNSIANVIVEEGLTDDEFIENHVNFEEDDEERSFDDFVQFLKDYSPEDVEEIVGIDAEKIKELARKLADPDKDMMSMWCMGINQRIRGVWANNLIHNIHLITGKICRPGSTPFSLTGQPSACGSVREVGALSHMLPAHRVVENPDHREEIAKIWGCDTDDIQDAPGKPLMDMFQATVDEEIKGMWVMCTNPGHSLPNVNHYREGMKKAFLVVSEGYHPTRTSELADVLLPAAVWCEKEGVYGNAERRTQHMEKAIEPPEGVKPDVWALLEVAKRLGYEENFNYESLDEIWDEYRETTLDTGMDVAPLDRYREERGLRWPVPDPDGPETVRRFVAPEDPYVDEEDEIKFYSQPDGRAKVFLRPHKGPAEEPTEDYPFYLTTGRLLEQWHTMTMTGQVPDLIKIDEVQRDGIEWFVEMNPEDAEELGLENGEKVKIESERGEITSRIKLDGRGKPQKGLLYMNFHDDDRDRLVNIVVNDAVDQASQQPEYKISAVNIKKA
ncbi:molybdopterin oxidoreductase family protein [Natranaerofaba carboxydovora]|uniref:molybdopterin oxidoreductase family protein n=1 Tax=Natranaerofaba carboxydovora TaxID=2742683 RepID=UPI001F12E9CA|nr:nitrate reductase [Natranaerofaba carboxydovora]UMZ73772.1 Periplasmic nitrate reductase [Natranaerofaba carboxydovora]